MSRQHALLSDFQLYLRFIWMQIRAQMQYKLNLVVDILSMMVVTLLEFAAVLLFFGPFPTMLGWKVGEVALLYAVVSIGFGIAELVGAGIDEFDVIIRRGEFDRIMLRPVGAFVQIFGNGFKLRRLGRIFQGFFALVFALHLLPVIQWNVAKLLVLVLGTLSGSTMFVAILLLGATLCFWTTETTELTNILTFGGREMLSYPMTIYHYGLQGVFLFVIPVAFGSFVPVCYVLDRALPFGLPGTLAFGAPLIALAFACVTGMVWRFGVQHYQSTGS